MKNPEIVIDLANRIPLDTTIWYFEELHRISSQCEKVIENRLVAAASNDGLVFNNGQQSKVKHYGKIIERILALRRMRIPFANHQLIPIAAARLAEMKQFWCEQQKLMKKQLAVFGDASASMTSAIEAATIIASMICACFDGELSFFNGKLIRSPHLKPTTVEENLQICSQVKASGCTSLAAALWPYYQEKKFVDVIVLVTDEEENTPDNGFFFAELLRRYKEKVNGNVMLIVICVGNGDKKFRRSLASNGITHKLVTIDGCRPDLTKFDALLGELALSMNAQNSAENCANISKDINMPSAELKEDEFVLV